MNNNTNNSILNNECAICYNYLFKRNTVFTLCCKQKIHKKCLDQCYGINNRCPFCRTNNQNNNNNIFINQNHHNLNIILINPYYIDYILLVIFSCLTITYLILRIIFSVIDIILLLLNEENLIII